MIWNSETQKQMLGEDGGREGMQPQTKEHQELLEGPGS
jgi:hypothetical protein